MRRCGSSTPRTGAAQEQRATAAESIEAALAAAWRVHDEGVWSGAPTEDRAVALDAMADHLKVAVPNVARLESIESGATLGITSMLGFILHGAFRPGGGPAALRRVGGPVRGARRRDRGAAAAMGPGVPAVPLERPRAHGGAEGGLGSGRRLSIFKSIISIPKKVSKSGTKIKDGNSESLDFVKLKTMLEELNALLAKNDIKASKKLKEIKAIPGIENHTAEINKIDDFLSDYSFGKSQEALKQLLDKI